MPVATSKPVGEINGTTTWVLAEQLTVIDPQLRLGEFAGRLSDANDEVVVGGDRMVTRPDGTGIMMSDIVRALHAVRDGR